MNIERTAAGMLIRLGGSFDAAVVKDGNGFWEQLLESSRGDVFVDVSGVDYLDASAIGLLAFLYKRLAERECRLYLIGPKGQPKRLLELLRIDRVIDVVAAVPAPPAAWGLSAVPGQVAEGSLPNGNAA